jgi:hypothetical protein
MDFTLRYTGRLPSGARHGTDAKHRIRCALHEQLADYWRRDPRLNGVTLSKIKAPIKTARHKYDVRPEGGKIGLNPADRFYAHSLAGIRFVPLVTTWQFLRCELSIRLYRYEGDEFHGRLLDGNGDLDNQLKTLLDALRMPHDPNEVPKNCTHPGEVFFCLLEDDGLISKLNLDTRRILKPTPTDRNQRHFDVEMDIRVVPIRPMGINDAFLYP